MRKRRIRTTQEIGALIKKRRKELGVSQENLAETLGVTYQQVQRYENGSSKLNVDNIQAVAEALSMPVTVFFGNDKGLNAVAPAPRLHPDETRLLKGFREIKSKRAREFVLQAVRLASRKP